MVFQHEGKEYILSRHAVRRMNGRDIDLDTIKECLTSYKRCIAQDSNKGEGKTYCLISSKISLILCEQKTLIITLYNYRKEYSKSRSKNRYNKKKKDFKKMYGNRLKRT